MAETLDLSRSVHDLAAQYPEFKQVMVSLGFTDIVKPAALNTVGRMMTVPRGCSIKGVDLGDAVRAFQDAGFTVAGIDAANSDDGSASRSASEGATTPGSTAEESPAAGKSSTSTESIPSRPQGHAAGSAPIEAEGASGARKIEGLDEAGRAKLLQSYVARLSAGEALETVRQDFVANFEDVDAAEIARAEQNLIEGGAKIDDVQRLCDVHSALFHGATREEKIANAESAVMDSIAQGSGKDDFKTKVLGAIPGHPVHVFSAENEAIAEQIGRTRSALGTPDEEAMLKELCRLGIHYAKKGDLIYPLLKTKHGYSGPSDVMWGVDDEIRAELRALATAVGHDQAWRDRMEAVLTRADEMVYKEANILLPLCVQNFTDEEWLQMYADMKGYDLYLISEADAGVWQTGEKYCAELLRKAEASAHAAKAAQGDDASGALNASKLTPAAAQASQPEGTADAQTNASQADEVILPTGTFTVAQLDALLNTLPLEITFIDDHEVNRYWNDDGKKKLFKRPASALGREVWNCHPPKVQAMVHQVIDTLKSGKQDSVDIWMKKQGEPVLVRYMAVRDRRGTYVGTMECVERMGFAQKHFSK